MQTQTTKSFPAKKLSRIALGILFLFAFIFAAVGVSADDAVEVTATVQNASDSVIISAPIGTMVHASVSVASSTGAVPTGTVDFNRYGNLVCSGSPTTEAGVPLSTNASSSATALSSAVSLPSTGLSYIVHYNGTSTYPVMDSTCIAVTAVASSTSITTTLSTTTPVITGSVVHDSATLSGATSNADGTVTYTVYDNNICTTGALSAGVGAVTNGVVGDSSSIQFNVPGTYYWQAVYGGNAQNASSTSACGSEVLVVVAAPTSTPIVNTAPIITLLGANPFNLFVGDTFVDPGATATDTPDGNLTASIIKTGTVNTAVVGTSTLVYSVQDSGALQASTTRTVVVNATTTTATTTPPGAGSGKISGTVYYDLDRNNLQNGNEPGLPGWKINLYKGAGWWGNLHLNAPFKTVTSDANGDYSFPNLADGVYSVEQIINKGWIQETADFDSITIANGSSKINADFGDITKKKKQLKKQFRQFWRQQFEDFQNNNGNNDENDD